MEDQGILEAMWAARGLGQMPAALWPLSQVNLSCLRVFFHLVTTSFPLVLSPANFSKSVALGTGLLVVVRLEEVGLVGEKGSKVPSASFAEISIELELQLTLAFEFSRCA